MRDVFKLVLEVVFDEEYVKFVYNVNEMFGMVKVIVFWEMIIVVLLLEGS